MVWINATAIISLVRSLIILYLNSGWSLISPSPRHPGQSELRIMSLLRVSLLLPYMLPAYLVPFLTSLSTLVFFTKFSAQAGHSCCTVASHQTPMKSFCSHTLHQHYTISLGQFVTCTFLHCAKSAPMSQAASLPHLTQLSSLYTF